MAATGPAEAAVGNEGGVEADEASDYTPREWQRFYMGYRCAERAHACIRARMHAYVRACICVRAHACMHACMRGGPCTKHALRPQFQTYHACRSRGRPETEDMHARRCPEARGRRAFTSMHVRGPGPSMDQGRLRPRQAE
eukprot:361825-Chlamydomonas_euryale.AAC.2